MGLSGAESHEALHTLIYRPIFHTLIMKHTHTQPFFPLLSHPPVPWRFLSGFIPCSLRSFLLTETGGLDLCPNCFPGLFPYTQTHARIDSLCFCCACQPFSLTRSSKKTQHLLSFACSKWHQKEFIYDGSAFHLGRQAAEFCAFCASAGGGKVWSRETHGRPTETDL